MTFTPKFTITIRMTHAITRIERAHSEWHRFKFSRLCDNFATWFTAKSCDRAVTSAVTVRRLSRQIAIQIVPFQSPGEAT